MPTSSPTLVEMLIGAIPAQDGAALVVRVGERARITSASGAVEVGTAALTAEAFDALSRQLLPAEQLQTLQQTGTAQGEFVAPGGAGQFAVVANSTNGSPSIEVRRHSPSTGADVSHATAAAPSVDSLVADLMSRGRSKSPSVTAATPAKIAVQPAQAPENVGVATPSEAAPLPLAPPNVPAAPVSDLDLASGSNDDLTIPTNFDFAQSKFDPDDLSVAETAVASPAVPSGVAQKSAAGTKAASATPARAASRTLSDRLSAYGRLSILLPAAILLGIGLPVVGWFGWTTYFPAAQPPASTPKTISRPTSPAAANVSQTGGAMLQARSKVPRVPMHAPSIQRSAPASLTAAEFASVEAAREPSPPPPPAAVSSDHGRSGFSVQVAAMRDRDEADLMLAKLVQQGYSGYVVNGDGAAAGYYRVRIGAFPSHDAAEAIASKIELTEGTKPWIVKETR